MDALSGGVRNGILNLKLATQEDLYASYMPFIANGGLFVPSKQEYLIGDEVFVLLQLLDEPDKIPFTGKVVWMSPKGLGGCRKQGIGIQLDESNIELLKKIEASLGGLLQGDGQTHTM